MLGRRTVAIGAILTASGGGGGGPPPNPAPVDIALTGASVAYNAASGTVVGTLSVTDPGESSWSFAITGGSGKFTLSAGSGATVQLLRGLSGSLTAGVSESVTVTVTDGAGGTRAETFSITVTDPSALPVDLVRPTFTARDPVIRFVGRGEAATRIVLLAQYLPQGWFPAGETACLRTKAATANGFASGSQIRTQIDVARTHPDGSAAIILIAAEVPRLNTDEVLACDLEIGEVHPSPGSTLVWSTAASGKSASTAMSRAGESAVTHDWLSGTYLEAGYWRQGPLVLERRSYRDTLPAPMVTSARLVGDVALFADGSYAVDCQWCNDAIYAGGDTGTWTGTITATLGGVEKLNTGSITHSGMKRLHREIASWATRPPAGFPDVSVMLDAHILPPLDHQLAPSATMRSNYEYYIGLEGSAWGQPYHHALIERFMPNTSHRIDLGYVPNWAAGWLCCGGSVYWHDVNRDFAEAGAGVPWHAWDRVTGSPLMVIGTRQGLWMHPSTSGWTPAFEASGDNGGWTIDLAHPPSLFFVPYLMTGRRGYLDGLELMVGYGVAGLYPGYTGFEVRGLGGAAEIASGECGNVFRGNMVRGAAWCVRTLAQAWICLPSSGPAAKGDFRSYVEGLIQGNLNWVVGRLPVWNARFGAYAGFISDATYETGINLSPWMQDYVLSVLPRVWLIGFDTAGLVLGWMADGWAGQRCTGVEGWNPRDGAAYYNPEYNTESYIDPIGSWAEARAVQLARGNSQPADTWTISGNFGVLCYGSFVELTALFPARTALADQRDWLVSSSVPNLTATVLSNDYIQFNHTPRGTTRGP